MSCTMYASTLEGQIHSIDCATGQATLEFDIRPYLEEYGLGNLRDIACHGGTMWGIADDGALIRINTRTGRVDYLGHTGFGGVVGLAVGEDGVIYGATSSGQIIVINPVTGEGKEILNIGLSFTGDLVFDCNNNLYGSVREEDMLVRIDLETGEVITIGPINYKGVTGLTFYCCYLYGVTEEGLVLRINTYSGRGNPIGQNKLSFSGMTTCCYNCGCGC